MNKDIILGLFLLTILSGCGVRKVQTNKSTTEIKETSVQAAKIDSTATNVVKKDIEEKKTDRLLDTGKTITDNKTVIEFFNPEGKLTKRITSNTNKQVQNYLLSQKSTNKKINVVDSSYLNVLSASKDSVNVSVKKVEKVKQTEAKRYNMLIFGIVLCVGVAMYLFIKRKY
jgi:DNA-directed RNA polymerase beta' subunit